VIVLVDEKKLINLSSTGLLLVLGSGNSMIRAKHAENLYLTNKNKNDSDLKLILSGGKKLESSFSEAEHMQIALSYSIPLSDLIIEIQSLDTLGNFVFSKPLIEQGLSGDVSKKLGVVTDPYHMNRSLWIAKHVLGSSYEVVPFATDFKADYQKTIKEILIKNALGLDFKRRNIKTGDFDKIKDFMMNTNMYSKSNEKSFYNTILNLYNLSNLSKAKNG
jgi:uncharacterized SAM-binding protein YcdF (DUF218 family)